jgi:ribosomal protein L7Ae-like RNA K-turn-binding protein
MKDSRQSRSVLKRQSLVQRLGTVCVSAGTKEEIFQTLRYLLTLLPPAERKQYIHLGSNNVMKSLERNRCAGVIVCRDAPSILSIHIIEAASLKGIPIVLLPRATADVASLFSIKSASVIGILKPSGNDFDGKASHFEGTLDKLLDYIINPLKYAS